MKSPLPSELEAPPLRYRALLLLLGPALIVIVLWQAWRARSLRFAKQRLGMAYPQFETSALWIHCASVGEVTAALPLIKRLSAECPHQKILVSTTTPTGADALLREKPDNVEHAYLPLDFSVASRSAIKSIKPVALILMETELWPHLINHLRNKDIPVVLVNGRLSAKTLEAPQWIKPVYLQLLSRVTKIFARSDRDAAGFLSLGAKADVVKVLGNIKYSSVSVSSPQLLCDIKRPFWLAASTRNNEEQLLCAELTNFELCSKLLWVIAPRHPDRSEQIQETLTKSGISFAVRSKNQEINDDTQIYLADTLGEMKMWLAHAQVVFVGGTLVSAGGHNLLEPASAAKPIVTGPHVQNVSDEAALLSAAGALYKAQNANDALQQIEALLADTALREHSGRAGYDAVTEKANVLEGYVSALLPLIRQQH